MSSIASFDSTSSGSSDPAAPAHSMCGASTTIAESVFDSDQSVSLSITDTSDDLCTRLDRARARRLDQQCAALRTQPRLDESSELGEILMHAGRLSAHRMSNQDYTPASVRRRERLERVSEIAGELPVDEQPRIGRESFLVGIAMRLARLDGQGGLARVDGVTDGGVADVTGGEADDVTDSGADDVTDGGADEEHPRDHMRRVLFRSIDRLQRLGSPTMDSNQRFHRQLTN
ncbi:hypothetical protein IWW50_001443 [Coemansia erecta]|nr:hypothetical protein GGF43_001590 [Coemansia sp. RSA 2618]KAJ2828327.1 hypothetical protein IWW50_001443 [Coemansia erecta]